MLIYANNIARVLIVGYVWPEPNSSAAGSRMLQLVRLFAERHARVVFASAAALSEHRFDLRSLGVEEKSIALNSSSFDDFVRELNPELVLFDRFLARSNSAGVLPRLARMRCAYSIPRICTHCARRAINCCAPSKSNWLPASI